MNYSNGRSPHGCRLLSITNQVERVGVDTEAKQRQLYDMSIGEPHTSEFEETMQEIEEWDKVF